MPFAGDWNPIIVAYWVSHFNHPQIFESLHVSAHKLLYLFAVYGSNVLDYLLTISGAVCTDVD